MTDGVGNAEALKCCMSGWTKCLARRGSRSIVVKGTAHLDDEVGIAGLRGIIQLRTAKPEERQAAEGIEPLGGKGAATGTDAEQVRACNH